MAAPAALLLPGKRNSSPATIRAKANDELPRDEDIQMSLNTSPIRIGYCLSLTGPLAGNSRSAKLAHDIWQEDVNAGGGLLGRPVELICHDDHGDASLVPDIYQRLIDVEGVDIVVGGYGTNSLVAAMPLIIQRQRFFVGLMGLGVNNTFRYPNYFAMIPTGPAPNTSLTEGFFDLASQQSPKPKTIALLSADAEFSRNPIIGAKENAKKYGFRIVHESVYPLITNNFVPYIDKVAESECDILFLCSYLSDSIKLVQAIRSHAFHPKMMGGAMIGPQNTSVKATLGPLLNGFVNYEYWVPSAKLMFPGVRELLEAYQSRAAAADVDPLGHYVAPLAYAQMQVVADAIKATGSLEDARLAEYARKATFHTVMGRIEFDNNGEWSRPRVVQVQFRGIVGGDIEQLRDGSRQTIVWPPELASGRLQFPYAQSINLSVA
jgi:branched-chain amino acid transport system substrate-binding protein